MAKYLITGGCGFIGSHLVEGLQALGHSVRILDNLSKEGTKKSLPSVEFVHGDVADLNTCKEALVGIDGCFHLAAISSVEQSLKDWSHTSKVNLLGTIHLFEAISQFPSPLPVIYASSAAIYAGCQNLPQSESDKPISLSPYGADKLGCENHARAAWEIFRIPSIGFRLFNVYGPGQDATSPYSGVISLFLRNIMTRKSITIYGDGTQTRDFVYIGDVIRFFLVALEKCHALCEVFNLCTGKGTSILTLAETIEKVMEKKVSKQFAHPRKGEAKASIGDAGKLIKTFGMKPDINLEEGLVLTIKHSF